MYIGISPGISSLCAPPDTAPPPPPTSELNEARSQDPSLGAGIELGVKNSFLTLQGPPPLELRRTATEPARRTIAAEPAKVGALPDAMPPSIPSTPAGLPPPPLLEYEKLETEDPYELYEYSAAHPPGQGLMPSVVPLTSQLGLPSLSRGAPPLTPPPLGAGVLPPAGPSMWAAAPPTFPGLLAAPSIAGPPSMAPPVGPPTMSAPAAPPPSEPPAQPPSVAAPTFDAEPEGPAAPSTSPRGGATTDAAGSELCTAAASELPDETVEGGAAGEKDAELEVQFPDEVAKPKVLTQLDMGHMGLGCTQVFWAVDARKLDSQDKQQVSPSFEVCFPGHESQTFHLIIYPTVVNDGRRGAGFKKAKGRGRLVLKCQSLELPASFPQVAFWFSVGKAQNTMPRGWCHNFIEQSCGALPKGKDQWDFKAAVDDSKTVTVSVYVQPQYSAYA